MRIIIISQYFPPDMGGGATRAYNAARGLLQAGHKVTVVSAFPHYPKGEIPNRYNQKPFVIERKGSMRLIRTFVPPLESKGFLKRILLFFSFILSSMQALAYIEEADVIWCANPNVTAMFSGFAFRRIYGCPLVQNVDDLWPEVLFDLGVNKKSVIGRLGRFLAGITYNLADAITPISPAYTPVIRGHYGVQERKIEFVRAGVDLTRFSKKESDTDKSSEFKVLYIGAFSPAYDFEQVFRAAELLAHHEDISLLLQGDGEMAEKLKKLEAQSKSSNIDVVQKIVSREEVIEIMQDYDALLLPLCGVGSIEMGISSKLYEYQAMSKPILCCSNGQPGVYVSESNSGIVIEPGDSNTLAETILKLRNDPRLAANLGANGRKYVEENLSVSKIGKELEKVFQKAISEKNL